MLTSFFIITAYLIGSISSAILVCQWLKLPDPRAQGSNNPGATNVLRVAGKKPAAIVLIADALKGFLPVFLAKLLGVADMALAFVFLAVVLGHIFPVFFQFAGGKGIAPTLGGFFALNVFLGLLSILVWFTVAKLTRYASLASMSAVAVVLIAVLLLGNRSYFFPLLIITILIATKHQSNIARLIKGTENKIGKKTDNY